MAYIVNLSKRALKDLEKISDPYYSNIKRVILNLADNPRPQGYIKLRDREGYRIRIGVYRVIYEIVDNQLLVEIITIGHRKEVYD